MRDMNKIHVTGRLVRDPELKYTGNGKAICNFAIAVNRGKDKSGNDYSPYFFDCKAWEKMAEIIAKYCDKGKQLVIQGHIEQQRWVDKETQKNRSRVYVIVDSMLMMGAREGKPAKDTPPAQQTEPKPELQNQDGTPIVPPANPDDDDIPF